MRAAIAAWFALGAVACGSDVSDKRPGLSTDAGTLLDGGRPNPDAPDRPAPSEDAPIQAKPTTGARVVGSGTPDSYVVPANVNRNPNVPTAELANYVVTHSEYSAPAFRRNLISALIASNEGTAGEVDESDDANVVESPAENVEEAK